MKDQLAHPTSTSPTVGTAPGPAGNRDTVGEAPCRPTDADVLVASWDDPSVFALLFDRHARVVHRYVASRAVRQDVDDVVSETFIAAFRSRHRYDPRYEDARPWLLGIAANIVRHHLRAEARRRHLPWRVALRPDAEADLADVVTARVDAGSGWEQVVSALNRLDERYREVLLLLATADLTYADVARALGIPVGTVRSRLARGRLQLRELLGAEGQYLGEPHMAPDAG